MNLRELAQGKPCMVRIPSVCNRNPETTVLAHFRMIGVSGMGTKSPDTCAAWACSDCHDYVDSRNNRAADLNVRRLFHLEGVIRTLNELHRLGYQMERKDDAHTHSKTA